MTLSGLLGVEPWMPVGYGRPHLYLTQVSLTPLDGDTSSRSLRVGFRTVELVQQPQQRGATFYIRVNGVPVFIKGANWVPADAFEPRITRDYLERQFASYVDANFNCLRVWGGGIYQSEDFYDLADEYGILVWQEFIFACALYPTDRAFLSSVALEVRDQVRRLAWHPSILLWGGNNENEAAVAQNWYGVPAALRARFTDMYGELYFGTVLSNLSIIDRSRPQLSSSPSNGDETPAHPVDDDPQDPTRGDVVRSAEAPAPRRRTGPLTRARAAARRSTSTTTRAVRTHARAGSAVSIPPAIPPHTRTDPTHRLLEHDDVPGATLRVGVRLPEPAVDLHAGARVG